MKMKNLIFCVAMNFISAIVLIGAGAMEMNNFCLLYTSPSPRDS